MKVIRNRLLPFRGYKAVNIMGVLFVREGAALSETDMTHEEIHSCQIRELLYVGFYVWYAVEWTAKLFTHRFDGHEAYRSVSFEREAYSNEADPSYISHRRHYAWTERIKK